MPWTGTQFAEKHNHKLHGQKADHAARIANAILKSGAPEGVAIATASRWAQKHRAPGGPVAPTVPTYDQGSVPQLTGAGLIPNVGGGSYQLDPNTGSLTAGTQQTLQNLAQRGMSIPNNFASYPTGASSAAAAGIGPAAPPPSAAAAPAAAAPLSSNPLGPTPEAAGAYSAGDIAVYNAMGSGDTSYFDYSQGQGASSDGWRGGRFAMGGVPTSSEMAPWFVRRDVGSMDHPSGLVMSATPGRKDVVPLSVASGSYVVPADVMSGISEGNTLGGASHLEHALHSGPGGMPLSSIHARNTIPHPPSISHLASGGLADGQLPRMIHPHEWANRHVPNGIPVMVAGGEYILSPEDVRHIGDGDVTRGHDKLDQFVLHARARNLKATAKLPGPKGANEP